MTLSERLVSLADRQWTRSRNKWLNCRSSDCGGSLIRLWERRIEDANLVLLRLGLKDGLVTIGVAVAVN